MGGRGGSSHNGGGGGNEIGGKRLAAARKFFTDVYGKDHAFAIMQLLVTSPAYIQKLFVDYAAQFKAGAIDRFSPEAYYSMREDAVFLGIEHVALGDSVHVEYQNIPHEYGHMIDSLIARDMGYTKYDDYSTLYKSGLLADTATKELEARLDRIMKSRSGMTREQAARKLITEAIIAYPSLRDRASISDMLQGAGIGQTAPLGAGHKADYFTGAFGKEYQAAEIFAEMIDAEVSSPGSLAAIKTYFPKTYKVFRQMIKERVKK